jgi:hypothetical protein
MTVCTEFWTRRERRQRSRTGEEQVMSEPTRPRSVWEDLPEFDRVRDWQKAVPDAANRILSQIEADAKFIRKDAERRLACALCIVILTLVATVVLALYDKVISSVFASSGGTIAVAITLITGRSSAISGKGRPNKKPSK